MNSKFTMIIRVLLGLILVASGLNKFCHLIETPAGDLIESFGQVDYIFPVVAVLEIFIGTLLLIKKWVPFALILLVPICVNILLFHFYLDFTNVLPAIVVAILTAILVYKHWRSYRPLFN